MEISCEWQSGLVYPSYRYGGAEVTLHQHNLLILQKNQHHLRPITQGPEKEDIMGLLSSSTHFMRYTVEGDPPADFWNFAADHIASHAFRDIDDSFEEISVGWVAVDNMFDAEFQGASFAIGDYLVLSLRIDERKVSPSMLKKFCLKEEERIKKERQIPRLSKNQRVELKENIHLALIKKTLPASKVFDLCWNLADGSLLFFSTNEKAQEILENFFKDTFGLHLARQIPYITAGRLLNETEAESLAALQPDIFI